MYGGVWGSMAERKGEYGEKGKCLANSHTAARVNVYYKLSSFFPILFQKQNRNINGSLFAAFGFFFQGSFLEGGLHISMTGRFIFSGGFIFRWRGHPIGVASALMGGGQKIHRAGGTPIMSFSTRANPGLCCKRIKTKRLQYALENLQEKDLNFTRKGTSSQINS